MSLYERILVPIDGGEASAAGLDEAIRLARLTGGELRLMTVLDAAAHATGFEPAAVYCSDVLPHMQRAGSRVLEEGTARAHAAGVRAQGALFETMTERVADLVLAQAASWPADLIVIGTHGRRGLDRLFMGSDAEQILRGAHVPVLLVRCAGEAAALAQAAAPPARARALVE